MANIAETVKKQTDRILRQRALNGSEGVVVRGVSSGTGAPAPTVNNPPVDLTAHKTSGDHDGRYYTEDEVDGLIASVQGAFAEVYRDTFSNEDTIVVEHNLGKRPVVQAIGQAVTAYGAGNYGAGAYGGIDSTANTVLTPSSIAHNSINQVTVTLSAAATGEVICVG
jgi:hypothetical protein